MAGSGGGSAAVRAGRAFVELFADDTKLVRGLESARKRLDGWASSTKKAGATLAAAGGAALAPIAASFTATLSRDKDIGNLADRLSLTTEKVSGLAYAFESVGSDLGEFTGTIDGFSSKMFAAMDGADESFRRLGLNARALGKLPIDQQISTVADALARVTKESDRAEMAQELFGASGLKLLPILRNGSQGFADLAREAEGAGAIVSGADAKRSQDLWKQFTSVTQSLKYAFLEIGAALLPSTGQIKDFAAQVKGIAGEVRGWIERNRPLVQTVALVAAGSVAAGAAIGVFGTAISALSVGLGVVIATLKLLFAGVMLLLSPIGLAVAAVTGLGVAWATQTESGKRMTSELGKGLQEFAQTAKTAWGGISSAVKKGDFGLAFEIAWAGVKVEWFKFVKWWGDKWRTFQTGFLEGWYAIGAALRVIFIEIGGWILRNTIGTLHDLVSAMAKGARALGIDDLANRLDRFAKEELWSDKQIDAAKGRAQQAEWDAAARRAEKAKMDAFHAGLDAQDDINRAAARFAELMDKAAEPNPHHPKPGGEPGAEGGAGGLSLFGVALGAIARHIEHIGLAKGADVLLPEAAKGAFSGPFGQMLGTGDTIAKRALQTGEKQVQVLLAIKAVLEGQKPLAFGK